MKKIAVIFLAALAVSCAGAADFGMPGEKEARVALENRLVRVVTQTPRGEVPMFVVKSFKKTDGQKFERGGIKYYKINWEADYQANADILVYGFKKGQLISYRGFVIFEKTESRWRLWEVEHFRQGNARNP